MIVFIRFREDSLSDRAGYGWSGEALRKPVVWEDVTQRDSDLRPDYDNPWLRFGVVISIAWLAFLLLILFLLSVDFRLGITVAIVGSILGAIAVMIVSLRRTEGETLVERWFG